jgi:modulator of FtsH protease
VIVAISINLKEIVGNRLLSSRAAETIGLLGGVLIVSTLVLVPCQPRQLLGAELIAVGSGGGLYWLVPAVVISLVGGLINSWVLLVEILR